jgi:hypothetical protein
MVSPVGGPGAALLPVPEPELTSPEVILRAQSFRQMLRDQQEEAERLGNYTPQVHEAFLKAGLYRILQPKRYGGYEFPPMYLGPCTAVTGHPSPTSSARGRRGPPSGSPSRTRWHRARAHKAGNRSDGNR